MLTIADVRQKFPQYNDMSDTDLAGALHRKYYSDMPVEEFNQKIGLAAPAVEPAPRAWSDVPGEALKNLPQSAYNIGAGAVKSAADVGGYAAPIIAAHGKLAPAYIGADAVKAIIKDPDLLRRLPVAAWHGLMERYGSEEALKKTIATDPAGFALDLATVVGGGEAAVSRIGRGVSEIGKAADVAKPFYDIPRGPEPPPPPPPPAPPPIPLEGGAGAVRSAVESQPRALTTESWPMQQAGQVLSKVPFVGTNIGKAIEAVPARFGEARNAVADEFGNYRTPQNVARDIGEHIGTAADAETQAAEAAALRADEAARANWEQTNAQRGQAISDHEAQSARETAQRTGDNPTTDMGDAVIGTVRGSEQAARARKDAAYREAGGIDATVLDRANEGLHGSVATNLRSDTGQGTVDLTAEAASASRGMMAKLKQFSDEARLRKAASEQSAIDHAEQMRREAGDSALSKADLDAIRAEADPTGKSAQKIEQLRQDLNFHAQTAANDADSRAARRIMSAFDEWHGSAAKNHLMEGSDPNYLPAFEQARAANRDWRQRFGYNDRNAADTILNKIVTGNEGEHIGPNQIAAHLTGNPDKAGPLLDSIFAATGDHPNHSNVVQAVRGGVWNKLSSAVEGTTSRSPERVASDIYKFLGQGRDVAGRLYSAEDQALMRRHADVLRAAVRARDETAALAKSTKPVPTEVVKGPAQELADRVLGRGQKPGEALFDTIEGYAKSKGGGKDIATLANVMAAIPEELRGNFRNTFIRRLGTGLREDFSPAKFAKEWSTEVNPQAKQVLFGDGAHVRALDELADASKTFDQVHRRFGNPSGSGHTINFAKVAGVAAAAATGALLAPIKLLGGWFAGRTFANFLATPQGAASAARFAKQMRRLQDAPSLGNAAAARMAVRNMRNTATSLGIAHNIPDTRE
jgi:hypothetical protein